MGSAVEFSWQGNAAMAAKLRDLLKEYPQKVAAALYEEANAIMTESKDTYVPVDLGTLRASGGVALPEIAEDGGISVQLYYGGAAAAYATAVHEHPSAHSPFSWQGVEVHFKTGGPKYLELPFNMATEGMLGRIAAKAQL